MTLKKGALVASSATFALILSACGGGGGSSNTPNSNKGGAGFNAGLNGVVNPSDKKGGTLKMANQSDIDSFDPARAYYAWAMNYQKSFYVRTLVTHTIKPGEDGLKLQPDLAEAMPTVSADKKTYTFKLKSGVKFEDGRPVTSKDIKYGVERIFAQDVLEGGPTYLTHLLDDGSKYPGPYKDPTPDKLGLKTVETPDDSTLVFHLAEPFADFLYVLSMPGASPVPRDKDTGAQYASHPISSGPYKFQSIELGKKAVLVRNDQWDPATDPVRKALPDQIDLALQVAVDEIDNQLLDGTLDIDTAQTGVQAGAQGRILLNPELKRNADVPVTGFTRYFTITTVPPFDNIHCRKAVQYAADKSALQTARGGAEAGGEIAGGMIPPTVKGHDPNLDPFNTKSGKPQLDKARDELKQCGHPDGFNTVIAARNKGKEPKSAEALQQALAQVGIKATLDVSDASAYFRSTIGLPRNVHKKGYGIVTAGWGPDWPSGYGFLQVLVDGRAIQQGGGNNNYGELNDPEINSLIDKARNETDVDKAGQIWAQIDAKVMDTATQLPFVFDKALNYRNPRMTNVFVQRYWGMWEFSTLGVS